MRIGIITDVHNNVIALKTMLEQFQNYHVDCICCLGDVIGIGPYPEETVQYLMKLDNLFCVYGNHEEYFMKRNYDNMRIEEAAFHQWEHALLSSSSKKWIESLPKQLDLAFDGVSISLLHYGYDDGYKQMLHNPTGAQLEEIFANVNSKIILYGHEHKTSVIQYNNRWFVNVGSLGCPGKDRNLCRGGLLTIENNEISLELLQIPYAVNEVLTHMEEVNCPAITTIQRIFYGKEKRL